MREEHDPAAQSSSVPEEDELVTASREGSLSAGENPIEGASVVDGPEGVLVGEIPSEADPAIMVWTVRCADEKHDLVGHYGTREEAERAKVRHLESLHGYAAR